jgi:hypothetical protein
MKRSKNFYFFFKKKEENKNYLMKDFPDWVVPEESGGALEA